MHIVRRKNIKHLTWGYWAIRGCWLPEVINLPEVVYKVAFPDVILFCAAFQKVEIQVIKNKVSSFSAIFLGISFNKIYNYRMDKWNLILGKDIMKHWITYSGTLLCLGINRQKSDFTDIALTSLSLTHCIISCFSIYPFHKWLPIKSSFVCI